MKWLLSLLPMIAMPVMAQLPPSPIGAGTTKLLSPKHAEHLASLGSPMAKISVASPAQSSLFLTWDYPADQITNVWFEVYHSTSPMTGPPLTRYDQIPSGFVLLTTVAAPPVTVGGLGQEYFINRAKDRVSGVYSNWNVK